MSRLGTTFRRARDAFPLTTTGTLVLIATFLGTWIAGVGHSDVVLLVGGFSLAVFLGLSVLLVWTGSLLIKRSLPPQRPVSPLKLEVGCLHPTEFSLKIPSWLPFLQFSWQWLGDVTPEVELHTEKGRVYESVRPLHRGEFDGLVRRILIRDSLRLAEIGFRFTQQQKVLIAPASGHRHQLALLNSLMAGDEISNPKGEPNGDRVDIRQYTKGDAPKTILWKVFARSRRLMVKVPERALASRPRVCCYLVATENDEPAAGLGRDLVQGDVLGEGWRFGADGLTGHCSGQADSILALARSGNTNVRLRPSEIETFLHKASQDGYGCCFVLVGVAAPNQRLEDVRRSVLGSSLKTVICLAVEGVETQTSPAWKRFFTSSEPTRLPHLSALEECWRFWSETGAEVRLADRSSGGVYRDVPALLRVLRRGLDESN